MASPFTELSPLELDDAVGPTSGCAEYSILGVTPERTARDHTPEVARCWRGAIAWLRRHSFRIVPADSVNVAIAGAILLYEALAQA
jgi:hypothetical protein